MTEVDTSGTRNRAIHIFVAILLACLVTECVLSMQVKSPTYDEPHHILGGYLALKKQEFSFMAENPPLLKSLIALPLLFFDFHPPAMPTEFGQLWQYRLASKFLFQSGNDVDAVVFLARLPIVFLSVLLGYYVFLWARRLYGDKAGLFALTLYVFCPNILAHSRLATLDLGVSCFMFISCYHFWDYLNDFSFRKYCLSALFLGVALVVKFTAIVLLPIFFIMLVVDTIVKNKNSGRGIFDPSGLVGPSHAGVFFLKHIAVLLFSVALMIYLAYGLRPDALIQFVKGWQTIFSSMQLKGYNYLLGEYYAEPKWYYPFYVLQAKTPVPVFILSIAVLLTMREAKKELSNELCLMTPVALIFAMSIFDSTHMGLRRFLPMYPFLFVLLSRVIPHLSLTKKPVIKSALALLMAWYVFSSVKIFPDYLTYFNELAGGPENGINILDSTNIDWGQDLKRLKPFMDKQGIENLKLIYFGMADPEYYGIKRKPLSWPDLNLGPQPGYYAISANILIRLKKIPHVFGFGRDWRVAKYEPIGIIGNTIYIFNFPPFKDPS